MTHAFLPTDFAPLTPPAQPAAQGHAVPKAYIPALDLEVFDGTTAQAISALLAPGRRRAFFMNAHCCNMRRSNQAYAHAVAHADILLPDGVGIELAGRMSGVQLCENLNGTDLVPALLKDAAKRGLSVFLFGGAPGAADAAATALIHDIRNLRIAGTRDGYASATDPEAAIAAINDSGADIVLVAMGVPMQELWLHKYADRLDAKLALGVGALFDFLSGRVLRAPAAVRRVRAEWAWRLLQEPRRLAKRYLIGNATFLAHAAKVTVRNALKPASAADAARRVLDVAVSASALVALGPVLMAAALAIKAGSPGPILFKQRRIGQNGVPFTMYKFRSMQVDAEQVLDQIKAMSDRDGVCFKAKNDPRITRVGKVLRRYSIDELPQIINVLRGDMAIVGPRPALPSEVAAYPVRALGRLEVKPGLTGVWQVSGRAKIGFDQMVEMDLSYAASRTVLLDVVLIFKTFRAVLSSDGAY